MYFVLVAYAESSEYFISNSVRKSLKTNIENSLVSSSFFISLRDSIYTFVIKTRLSYLHIFVDNAD